MHEVQMIFQNAVGRLLNSGNASESLLGGGDTGGLSMVSRLGAENRSKSQLQKVCKTLLLMFRCRSQSSQTRQSMNR